MKVAIIYNKDLEGVINVFGMQNKEKYSPETIRKVASALEAGGHNVSVIDGNMHVVERLQNFMPRVIGGEQIGMVFNMAYGIQGESRYTHIPSMLEMLGIPYVGSGPSGHSLALDKTITKIIMQKHQVPTPEFWVFSGAGDDLSMVNYPVIVKPKMESVSFGLKVVDNKEDLKEAIDFIVKEFQQQALVEKFIPGREFCVGLIGNNPVEAFPVLEIDLGNDPSAIQTLENKSTTPMGKICPANIPKELADEMVKQSIAAFNALQLRDFARVDIRMDNQNNIYLLEINSMASLGATGSYRSAAEVAGYNFKSLINKILDVAVVRYFSAQNHVNETIISGKTPLHSKLRVFLRSRKEQTENLLKKCVNINTYTRNVEGVNEFGNLLKKELSALGFTQEVYPQVEVGNQLFFTNSMDSNYDVLFLGFLDNTTKIGDHEFFRLEEQKIYGTGVWVHKAGIVTLVSALQALRFTRVLRKIKIGILLTTDDSLQGKFAKSQVMTKSSKAKFIISLHGGDKNGSIVTSRSGNAVYKISTSLLRKEHSEDVAMAASVFYKLINTYCDLSINDEKLVIAPSNMEFRSSIMNIHAYGEAEISVRFNDMDAFNKIDKQLREKIPARKYRNILHFQIEGGLRRPPMPETKTNLDFWNFVKKISQKIDVAITKEHRWSSSDICFIDVNKHILDGFGPVGSKDVGRTEFILRHSLLERSLLIAMTLNELIKRSMDIHTTYASTQLKD